LTTVRVDKAAMGCLAAEQLIAQIEGEQSQKQVIQTPVELVIRQTT